MNSNNGKNNYNNEILLSVCMTTYNHEDYISQAIESVLMQLTNFRYELVIGEDCSTDNTRKICIEYKNKYPEKIKLLLREQNLGMFENGILTMKDCKGKYIATLEGDDYWTDPNKLQKQVDFLEKNQDFSVCFHKVRILQQGIFRKDPYTKVPFKISTVLDLAKKGNYIHTCSSVFRNKHIYHDLPKNIQPLDYAIHLVNTKDGEKIIYIKKVMAVYRIHPGGVWRGADKNTLMKKELSFYVALRDCLPDNIVSLLLYRFILIFTNHYLSLTNPSEKDEFLEFVISSLKVLDKKLLLSSVVFKVELESDRHILYLIKKRLFKLLF